jgi:C1A family cysteine protease
MEDESTKLAHVQAAIRESGAKWVAATTELTGLSRQEKELRLGAVPPPDQASLDTRERIARASLEAGVGITAPCAPAAYDLTNVAGKNFITPVRNQRNCGSCVAFGTIAAVEGTTRVKRNDPSLDVDLSEAHLFYCHGAAEGRNCGNGWWPDNALNAARDKGVVDETCYPYTAGDQPCRPCSDWQSRVTKISAWSQLSTAASMKEWLSTNGPVAACFKVYDDFYSYHSGIYRYVTGDLLGGHCVCVVGYNDADGCWLCKNSWGTTFGENGFFRIGYGECGIDYTMWAVQVPVVEGEWLKKKQITGLWIINEERNAAAYVGGVGWRELSRDSDSVFQGMLTLLSSAKASKAPVDLRIENDVIKEVYVF